MKWSYQGVSYDTEKSTKLGSYVSDLPRNDLQYCECDLYITKNGEYFLAGEGGANTIFAHGGDRHWSAGKGICPLYDQDSIWSWANRCMEKSDFLSHFGDNIPAWY